MAPVQDGEGAVCGRRSGKRGEEQDNMYQLGVQKKQIGGSGRDPTIKTSLRRSHAWPTTHGSGSPRHQQPSLCFYATLPLADLIFFFVYALSLLHCRRCFL